MAIKFLKNLPQRKIGLPFFIILFLLMAFSYNLHETMFYRPQSTHVWRQTDCLSMTQHYYQYGNKLWEPEIHNQFSDGDLTGKTAGEFPILYFTMGQLWKVIGKSEFAYRLFVLIISFIGLFLIFKFSQKVLKSDIQALFTSLGLFTAVTYVYYSASFISNLPALSMIFIAWYFIWKFYEKNSSKQLWLAMLFFSLAMLLKVSAGISFIALFGWLFIEILRKKENRILFKEPLKQLIPFLVVVVVVFAWYWYVSYYNDLHEGKYTFNRVWPIWEIPNEKIFAILKRSSVVARPSFFHISMLYVSGAMWLISLATFKKRSVFLNYLLVIVPFGSIVYSMMWFQAFDLHDYYYIDFYPTFVLVWIVFFKTMGEFKWFNHWVVNLLIIGFLVYNVIECEEFLNKRYVGWMNRTYTEHLEAVGELEPVFESIGVLPDDKVISIPDKSINISLYLMNRRGFCNYNGHFNVPGKYQERIDLGAKYLIVNDTTVLDSDKLLQPFLEHPITTYRNVKIFDLRPYSTQ